MRSLNSRVCYCSHSISSPPGFTVYQFIQFHGWGEGELWGVTVLHPINNLPSDYPLLVSTEPHLQAASLLYSPLLHPVSSGGVF